MNSQTDATQTVLSQVEKEAAERERVQRSEEAGRATGAYNPKLARGYRPDVYVPEGANTGGSIQSGSSPASGGGGGTKTNTTGTTPTTTQAGAGTPKN